MFQTRREASVPLLPPLRERGFRSDEDRPRSRNFSIDLRRPSGQDFELRLPYFEQPPVARRRESTNNPCIFDRATRRLGSARHGSLARSIARHNSRGWALPIGPLYLNDARSVVPCPPPPPPPPLLLSAAPSISNLGTRAVYPSGGRYKRNCRRRCSRND